MYQEFDPNPVQNELADDCTVRAIAKSLGVSWEAAYTMLAVAGFLMGDVFEKDYIWGAVLRENGFKRRADCEECETVAAFARSHPKGVYVLKTYGHILALVDGTYYDASDSGHAPVIYYWVKED